MKAPMGSRLSSAASVSNHILIELQFGGPAKIVNVTGYSCGEAYYISSSKISVGMMGEEMGKVSPFTRADLKSLVSKVDGEVVLPGDEAYDRLRSVFNGSVDHRPSLILQCAGAGDVMSGVVFAREHRIPLSVKAGGNSVSGSSVLDDGMVLDLGLMKDLVLDEDAGTVRAGPGLTWGELDKKTAEKKLAVPGGVISTTGISGHTLDGGVGWLMGAHGLTSDNLVSADVVTADGDLLTASEDERADLFWALRGAGSNFGAVTSFEYRLRDVGKVYGGTVAWPVSKAIEVLRGTRRLMKTIPDELDIVLAILDVPVIGPAVAGMVCYLGEQKAGEKALDPLIRVGRPDIDGLGMTPYLDLAKMADITARSGLVNHWKSGFMTGLSDDSIKAIVSLAKTLPSEESAIHIWCHHGTVTKRRATATAFPHREKQFNVHLMAMWEDPHATARNVAWATRGWGELSHHLTGATYAGFTSQADGSPMRIFKGNLDRLRELKQEYDPGGMFRGEHPIAPLGPQ